VDGHSYILSKTVRLSWPGEGTSGQSREEAAARVYGYSGTL